MPDFYLDQSHTNVSPSRSTQNGCAPDVMELEADPSKIRRHLGWEVEIPFEHTMKDLLAYWRQRIESTRR